MKKILLNKKDFWSELVRDARWIKTLVMSQRALMQTQRRTRNVSVLVRSKKNKRTQIAIKIFERLINYDQ